MVITLHPYSATLLFVRRLIPPPPGATAPSGPGPPQYWG